MKPPVLATLLLLLLLQGAATADTLSLADQARDALQRSTAYFQSISTRGGYLWWYSEDLKQRAGESKASASQVWVQPPGTPSVGEAFLRAYEVTLHSRHLEAARAAAEALAWGQLASGGWTYQIDFDPANQRWYRRVEKGELSDKQIAKRRNVTTFDDDTTQSALRFLMAFVVADTNASPQIRAALDYGLAGLLRAQYPNGAWPQGFDGSHREPGRHQSKSATVPDTWSRTPDVKEYWHHYTFNDNAMRNCITTLLDAHRKFRKPEYLAAAKRAGDFILRAQLPAPQRAWAQQYNFNMEPAWARRFEPPAVSSGETAGIIRTLVDLYRATGDKKYLEPIPAAIDWLKRSEISVNKWARFYEPGSNKPLYFTREYRLVYTDDDLPTHYGFQGEFGIPDAIAYYRDAFRRDGASEPTRKKSRGDLESNVRKIISALDAKGRWVQDGRIESRVFIANVNALCDYLAAE